MRVVLATGNAGKLRELRELLTGLPLELVAQTELGVKACDEPAATFLENALIKARHAARVTGLPAIADDSGLVVDALGGAPGVRSARYAGAPGDDAANNRKLLEALRNTGEGERGARFVCAAVFLADGEDPCPLVAVGVWEGRIVAGPRGDGGFGYDPLFEDPDLGRTSAELPAREKNRVSHRARAFRELARALKQRLALP